MIRRYVVLGVVWAGCTAAWMLLGATLLVRSGETSSALVDEVHQLWGPPLDQAAPGGQYTEQRPREERRTLYDANGRPYESTVQTMEDVALPSRWSPRRPASRSRSSTGRRGCSGSRPTPPTSRAATWCSTTPPWRATVTMSFPLPARGAIYDGFEVLDDQGQPIAAEVDGGAARWIALPRAGGPPRLRRALPHARDLLVDVPAGRRPELGHPRLLARALGATTAASTSRRGASRPARAANEGQGWRGTWEFKSLVGSAPISLELPQKTNPGPLAARITFFAPVALLFYFFVVGLLAEGRGHRLHPLSWFLIGCAFFADHLLFAYLADHVPLWVALTLSSAVSILLAVTYAQWLVGWRFALREMGLAQLVYLVGFSLTFLLKGFTGLSITVGAILTLFMMMQVTGRRLRSDVPRAELVG